MKGDRIAMSSKERNRKLVLSSVAEGKLSLIDASKKLQVSYRQIKRIYKRYGRQGDMGLIHGSYGRTSHNAYSVDYKEAVLNLYREKYEGFGPTLACEKLGKDGYKLSDETLRLWLIQAGLWDKKRKRKGYRKQRARRACFGELLQLDGSHHRWFGAENPASCLMNLVDDASGITLSLLAEQETTEAAFQILRKWTQRYGVPSEIYVDLKTVYVSPQRNQEDGEPQLNRAFTHFSRACEKLGITLIKAYSPQAKGRVERNHAVYQDRFVKELKLLGMKTLDEANKLLDDEFIDNLNQKFAKAPQSEVNAHRNLSSYGDPNQIFCWEYKRVIQQDWTVSLLGERYQIGEMKPLIIRPRQSIICRRHLDGSVSLWNKDQILPSHRIAANKTLIRVKTEEKKEYEMERRSQNARKNRAKTPWNLFNPDWLKKSKQGDTLSINNG